ncbi:MAG: pyruvate kinase [Candidatus Woesearchaeota archaeon]
MNYRDKNTKIVATISDLRCDVEFIQDLYDHGMDVVRLNTAHQDEEGSLKVVENVRAVSDKIGLLLDTKGPEIRTVNIDEPIDVKKNDTIKITGPKQTPSTKDEIQVTYAGIVDDIPIGSAILIDDGHLKLIVGDKTEDALICHVENDGYIKKKKSVNIPDVSTNLPSLTEKDIKFIRWAAKHKLDFIAHSFVRNKQDVLDVQKILDEEKSDMGIISKIENREGVDNIEEILDVSYGVMVARGDLGIEIPASEIPLIQKRLIEACVKRSKPVITATHMLESMIENPRATRAEVSDVANAILDGTSAIMLSGETAYGNYPVEAVKTMSEISLHLKERKVATNPLGVKMTLDTPHKVLAQSAVDAALNLNAKAIIVPSVTGKAARFISSLRSRKPVYAQCYKDDVMRKLSLSHGIRVSHIDECSTTDALVYNCVIELLERNEVQDEDLVVIVAGTPYPNPQKSHFLEIAKVKDVLAEYK